MNLESMTGYGEHRALIGAVRVLCRVRSLNHRFLDVKVRLPRGDLMSLDLAVRKKVAELIGRGAVEISILPEPTREATENLINTKLAESYWKASKKLSQKLLKKSAVSFEAILRLPGVVQSASHSAALDELFEGGDGMELLASVAPALKELQKARTAEGAKLKKHLIAMLDEMNDHLAEIKKLEPAEKERARQTLTLRVQETAKLLGAAKSDSASFENRLREEASFWIEKRDFTEERVRLETHLSAFRGLLEKPTENPGRKLEFLHQELLREVNTLGNKAQSTTISQHTVGLKSVLEKIKEQLANVA